MPHRLAILVLLLASLSCRQEKTNSFEGRRISAVEFRFIGNVPPVDEERLLVHMKTKPGDACQVGQLDDDLKSLYESGFIEDMQWLAEPDGEGIKLIAEITPRPPLGPGHGIIGNTAFSDRKLVESVDFESWTTMEGFPESMRRRIENFYRQRGYPEATVRCEPLDLKGYYQFIIREGRKNPPP